MNCLESIRKILFWVCSGSRCRNMLYVICCGQCRIHDNMLIQQTNYTQMMACMCLYYQDGRHDVLLIAVLLERLLSRRHNIIMLETAIFTMWLLSTTSLDIIPKDTCKGCTQLLELFKILEISWNLVDAPGNFYNLQCNFRTPGDFQYTVK